MPSLSSVDRLAEGTTKVRVRVNQRVKRRLEELPKEIAADIFPPVVRRIGNLARQKMREKVGLGDRSLMTRKVWQRFPTRLRDTIKRKTRSDDFGRLILVGPSGKAGQLAHFDHGEKALTDGRNHILWGRRPQPQRIRKQKRRLDDEVARELEAPLNQAVTSEIKTRLNAN